MLKVGIIGLPNVGKSTLFNSLTNEEVDAECFPFCTVDPNASIIPVSDDNLEKLRGFFPDAEVTPTKLKFVDIAGLVKNAHRGEGLGNEFLSHIREVDAIIHLVRCFENPNVSHVASEINPLRDIEIIQEELRISDQEIVERALTKNKDLLKKGKKEVKKKIEALENLEALLEESDLKRSLLNSQEKKVAKEYQLLSFKPTMVIANISEKNLDLSRNNCYNKIVDFFSDSEVQVEAICAKLEEELSEFDDQESRGLREELGVTDTSLTRIVKASYKLLDLITYYTVVGQEEITAWSLKRGKTVLEAAAQIHTDMAEGFIKATVISLPDLIELGSLQKAKEQGKVMVKGRDYKVQDKDIIEIKFQE